MRQKYLLEINLKICSHDNLEMNVRIHDESNKSCVNFHMICYVFSLLIAKQIKNDTLKKSTDFKSPKDPTLNSLLLSWPHSGFVYFELIWCMNHHSGSSSWYTWPPEVPENWLIISRWWKLFINYILYGMKKYRCLLVYSYDPTAEFTNTSVPFWNVIVIYDLLVCQCTSGMWSNCWMSC
jgi:hypothetical protein